MRSLWSQWPHIRRTVAHSGGIFLFDFDGTLAPIAADPSRAGLPEASRAALAHLAGSSRVALGIVSGRKIADLRSLVGLKNIYYIGSHGLEWMPPGGRRQLRATPLQCRRMRRLASQLQHALRDIPGILVEPKVASVAVHYRKANARDVRMAIAEVQRAARQHTPRPRLLKGKKVIELLPPGTRSKGATVKTLLSHLRRRRLPLTVYLGDDVTDETVFRCLGKKDFSVLVGRPRRTRARFYLRSPGQVRRFLKQLGEITICPN